jgi:hypothetical protein
MYNTASEEQTNPRGTVIMCGFMSRNAILGWLLLFGVSSKTGSRDGIPVAVAGRVCSI